jgi:hypothetical protein
LQAVPAQALEITFVSGNGNNANDCSRATPCRTFIRAYNRTAPGGEIRVLDAGSYGDLEITKAISVVSESPGEALIHVPAGGTGITISAGATDVINLRGITISGAGGSTGIVFNSGALLTVENCVIRDLTGTGIIFRPNASAHLAVSHTMITKVGGRGIHVNPASGASGTFTAVIARTEVHGTTDIGFFAHGTGSSGALNMTVVDSISTKSPGDGIRANSLQGAVTVLTVIRSVSAGNGTGISAANGNATVRVGQSTVTGNASGWLAEGGGTLQSYGGNHVNGNSTNEGAIPLIAMK